MSEISTEELAQRLEFVADARRDGLFEVDKEELLQAAARLRALAEDAERYQWLKRKIADGQLTISKVGMFELYPWSGDDPDSAIDKARHD